MRTLRIVLIVLLALLSLGSLPPGTQVRVRIKHTVTPWSMHTGDTWDGELAGDLRVGGQLVGSAGAAVHGKVEHSEPTGTGEISIRLTTVAGAEVKSNILTRHGAGVQRRGTYLHESGFPLNTVVTFVLK